MASEIDKNLAKIIEGVIFSIKTGKLRKARQQIKEGMENFHDNPLLSRAHAEVMLALALNSPKEHVSERWDYFYKAFNSAKAARDSMPNAIEFAYGLARVFDAEGFYKQAVEACERALLVDEYNDPYEGVSYDWTGENLETTTVARIAKVREKIASLMKDSKIKFLKARCHVPSLLAKPLISLQPQESLIENSPPFVPNHVFQCWGSSHCSNKWETITFTVFDLLEQIDCDTPYGSLLLDLIYRFCLGREWQVWLCGICGRKFSNSSDHGIHIMDAHTDNISTLCHTNLPEWSIRQISQIWKGKGLVKTDKHETEDDVKNLDGFVLGIFDLSVELNDILYWLYGGPKGLDKWFQKVVEIEEVSRKPFKEIKERVEAVKFVVETLKEREKMEGKVVSDLELQLMRAVVDIGDFVKVISLNSIVDSRLAVEPLVKQFLQVRMEGLALEVPEMQQDLLEPVGQGSSGADEAAASAGDKSLLR